MAIVLKPKEKIIKGYLHFEVSSDMSKAGFTSIPNGSNANSQAKMAAVCQLNAWVTCFRFHVVQTKNDSTKMAAGTRQTDVFAQPHHADEIAVCLQRTHNTVLLPNSQTILCPCGAAQPKTHRNIGECGGKDAPGRWLLVQS
ncbi:hypothetical protein NDU88_004203 [Pleurodeles waltl]|uniref:Uncharacterized protein n=1 Tax=Pleurodeles waltl TaxID=8319 RepID=A0AAV7NMS6_PLEWA|nr:hypothetical protein NDU88_004203 [Pleurodeles waltl]